MKCFPYKIEPNVVYGNAILGALPNTFGSNPLPLLVRETIQNSLDASKDPGLGEVTVSFDLHSIKSGRLSQVLDSTRFRGSEVLFLEISDYGTTGLDGTIEDVSTVNEMGRFWRFVLSMGVNQAREGAGGSWGMGKSLYHLAGTGLVIFDSMLDSGERRLCAKWVFDQRVPRPEELELPCPTGVVFWGSRPNVPETTSSTVILEIEALGLPTRTATGTSCYIMLQPDLSAYLDVPDPDQPEKREQLGKELLQRMFREVNRWYFPRLIDSTRSKLVPVFPSLHRDFQLRHPVILEFSRLVEKAHDEMVSTNTSGESAVMITLPGGGEKVPIGTLVWDDYSFNHLEQQGWTPTAELLCPETDEHPRSYCALIRGAGMVVKFDSSLLGEPDSTRSVRLGVLLIDSNRLLPKPGNTDELVTAEEYFRHCEGKDHSGWDDLNWGERKYRERTNYFRYMENAARSRFATTSPTNLSGDRNRLLGRLVGGLLLGDLGAGFGAHGKVPGEGGGGHGGGGSGTTKVDPIELVAATVTGDGLINFKLLVTMQQGQTLRITAKARSGTEAMDTEEWATSTGTDAPWSFLNLEFSGDSSIKAEIQDEVICISCTHGSVKAPFNFTLSSRDPDLMFDVEGKLG